MLKYLFGIIFFFPISLINAQNEIEYVKKDVFSEKSYIQIRSSTSHWKDSKTIYEGKADTSYMHICNDSVIYHFNKDSCFRLCTKEFYYQIYDSTKDVSFRIVDSTYIWGWNYPKIFDFIEKELSSVNYSIDTIYFILKNNRENISKVRYYKNDFIHIDIFNDTEYNSTIYFVTLKPTNIGLPKAILNRMKRIEIVNDSIVFNNTCSGYSIDCYNMSQLPTKHYFYINQ